MINCFSASVDQEEIESVKSCFDSYWLGCGEKVDQFEKNLAKKLNVPDLVMVNSGTSALSLAVRLLNLPPKSSIICPSFTFPGCVNSIILNGHIPVFADVDYDTCNISENCVARVINGDCKAIMVVHYAGLPVVLNKLSFGLPVIEDCAHAVCSQISGKSCGSIGDIGIYSFDPVKNIASSNGGAIIGKNDICVRARSLRFCGINKTGFFNTDKDRWWESNISGIVENFVPNDVSASIGLAQLEKLDKHQKIRKEIWNRYQNELKGVEKPLDAKEGDQHSYFTYLIKVKNRDELAHFLLDNGVFTTLKFQPCHHIPIYQKYLKHNQKLPNTDKLAEMGLNIPLHSNLNDSDVDKIIELINKFTQ